MLIENVKVVVQTPEPDIFKIYLKALRSIVQDVLVVTDTQKVIETFAASRYEVLIVQITEKNHGDLPDLFKGLGLSRETTMIVGIHNVKAPQCADTFDFLLEAGDCPTIDSAERIIHSIIRLARKVKAQTDLSAMLIHDMRSPLQSILSYSELLQEGVFGALNEGQQRIMENTLRLTDTLLELMAQLGDVLRFENKSLHIHPEWFPAKVLLQDVIQSIWIQADKKNIKFSFNGTPDGAFDIFADRMALFRVLSNLLTNAVQHSPENSVIRLSMGHSAEQHKESCFYIRITDSGPGIRDKDMEIIFDKFYRSKAGIKKGGFGLGLYVARLYVEAHGGSIRAHNNREGGSTFQISIPIPSRDNAFP